MLKDDVLNILKKLGETEGIDLVCLVRKNGDVFGSTGSINARQIESFGIMSATIYGAAKTANEQLKKEKPENIVINGQDGETIISKVDASHILVVRTQQVGDGVYDMIDKSITALQHTRGDSYGQ